MSQFWQNLQPRLQPACRRRAPAYRKKVIQRLLLYGIDAIAARTAVSCQYDLAVLASTHKAKASLAVVQFTEARTDVALDSAVVQTVPVFGGNYARGKF